MRIWMPMVRPMMSLRCRFERTVGGEISGLVIGCAIAYSSDLNDIWQIENGFSGQYQSLSIYHLQYLIRIAA